MINSKDISFIKDKNTQNLFSYLFQEVFGQPISFSAVPTLADMDANTWGFYGNDIYIKTSSGTGIKLSGASFS